MFGLAAFVAALVVRLALDNRLPAGFPFLTFFPAVIVTTFLAGLWPGILTALLSGLASWYFFLGDGQSLTLTPGGALALGFFGLVVAVDIAVIHIMTVALERLAEERNRSARLTHQTQVMFSELQHRVSNNLQLASSLITIQKSKVKDPDAHRALEEAAGRLSTLGRLHRRLHAPHDGPMDMEPFLRELCEDILKTSGAERIGCTVSATRSDLPPDTLIPLALILTELVSNALEHGFPDGQAGRITVDLRAGGGGLVLTVRDDGAGLPDGFALTRPSSLGLQIVTSLAAQIGGTFSMTGSPGRGTEARLMLPPPAAA
ncbi:sensor histidine kinase [Azospirillum isscasi]|uniref:histidine kinase n=1 Tax=Azospirillum isscasi TaxID=3053926 RepID=A0ABU0WEV6_9PROT|nr:histidine kinase dimerization/phosphoacceptor domain -containing protein [Azospirillum isscasi]MDQ2102741.1 histidine kinase dimerization/phosphoacceptor domain -containing protein [Azospirillum isscasi]